MPSKIAVSKQSLSDNGGLDRAFTNEMHQSLEGGRVLCLSSLLWNIGNHLYAEETGIFESDIDSEVSLHRRIRVCQPPNARAISNEQLASAFDKMMKRSETQERFRFSLITSDMAHEFGLPVLPSKRAHYFAMVALWPSPYWNSKPHSRYWAYFLNPVRHNPEQFAGRADASWEILRLCVDWTAWKHHRLSYRERCLKQHPQIGVDHRVVDALKFSILRPLQPRAFMTVVDQLIVDIKKIPSESWTARAVRIAYQINEIVLASSPCQPKATCIGCSVKSLCPQNDYEVLIGALGQMARWSTKFWRDAFQIRNKDGRGDFCELLDDAIRGLRMAAEILDKDRSGIGDLSLGRGHERLLLRFFIVRAIHDSLRVFESRWTSGVEAQLNELQFLSCLSGLAVLLLTEDEWRPDAIRDLIRVMAGYGHLVLGVPPWLDLARHLRQTLRGESALYTLKQRYRDHFFHTIEVCLIGYALLVSRPHRTDHQDLKDWIGSRCQNTVPVDGNDLLAQWWVASLLHDTAYGIDVLKGTLDLLNYFENEPAISEFSKNVKTEIKKLHQQLVSVADELRDDKSLEGGDHGAITASHLVASLKKHGEKWLRRFLPAVRAIAFHNTKFPRVNSAHDPVAALLILCDTVQDWGRSQLGFDRSPTVVLSRLVSAAGTPSEEQFGPVKDFEFSMTPLARPPGPWQPCMHVWRTNGTLEILLEYDKRVCKGPTIFFTWADTTHNLQRVDFSSWELKLQIKHRIPHIQGDQTKMGELVQHVRQEEAGFLEPWISEACSGNESGALCYGAEQRFGHEHGWESLTFNAIKLGATLGNGEALMGISLAQFGRFIDSAYKKQNPWEDHDPEQRPPM